MDLISPREHVDFISVDQKVGVVEPSGRRAKVWPGILFDVVDLNQKLKGVEEGPAELNKVPLPLTPIVCTKYCKSVKDQSKIQNS